jgi:hypothetical protein
LLKRAYFTEKIECQNCCGKSVFDALFSQKNFTRAHQTSDDDNIRESVDAQHTINSSEETGTACRRCNKGSFPLHRTTEACSSSGAYCYYIIIIIIINESAVEADEPEVNLLISFHPPVPLHPT